MEGNMKGIRGFVIVVLFSVVLLLASANTALALSYNGKTLSSSYPIVYESSIYFDSAIEAGQYSAIYDWNNAAGVYRMSIGLALHYYEEEFFNETYSYDGHNRIYRTWDWYSGAVGLNKYWCSGSTMVESDINYNPHFVLGDGSYAGYYDYASLFYHEVSHTLGFADTYNSGESNMITYGYVYTGVVKTSIPYAELVAAYNLYH